MRIVADPLRRAPARGQAWALEEEYAARTALVLDAAATPTLQIPYDPPGGEAPHFAPYTMPMAPVMNGSFSAAGMKSEALVSTKATSAMPQSLIA